MILFMVNRSVISFVSRKDPNSMIGTNSRCLLVVVVVVVVVAN